MSKINYSYLKTSYALSTLKRNVAVFKKAVENDKSLRYFGDSFSWEIAEKRHIETASSDSFECAFALKDGDNWFSLDMSQDIESFGYNEDFFSDLYGDRMDNLWCCEICSYRRGLTYDGIASQVVFLYDKEKKEIAEIIELERRTRERNGEKSINHVASTKRLEKILEESKSSQ